MLAAAIALRREPRSVVHIHYATQGVIALAAGRPYVIHCHGSDVRGARPGSLRGRILAPILRRAALVLYATPDLAADVRRFRNDAVFLPNPIDTGAFTPGGAATRDVLLATSLDQVKGSRQAIDALDLLLAERPQTTVTVVAAGPMRHEARAVLGGRVRFVAPVAHETMPDLLRDHRVAVGQFRLGILSQLELEALACGIPMVTGFHHAEAYPDPPPIVGADVAADIAARVKQLLGDEVGRSERGSSARAWVLANHDFDRVSERLCEAYAGAGLVSGATPADDERRAARA
jgi:glycosyltransferase involved in cell wall biosynthesis